MPNCKKKTDSSWHKAGANHCKKTLKRAKQSDNCCFLRRQAGASGVFLVVQAVGSPSLALALKTAANASSPPADPVTTQLSQQQQQNLQKSGAVSAGKHHLG